MIISIRYPELNKLEYSVKIKAIFERTNFASNLVAKIPVPPNAATVKVFSAASGKAKYEPDQNAIMWRIKKFQGDMEFLMSAEVVVTPLKQEKQWSRPPISLDFQVSLLAECIGTHVHRQWSACQIPQNSR